MKGYINSIQSLGALDGPGIRFAVFLQGCNLRCGCCHNPDTWDIKGGTEYTPLEIVQKAERFREYFGKEGGITFSGGEPLLQADFVREVFSLCKEKGINTCLDTSGSILNDKVKKLLSVTDRVLLDIKYTDEQSYKDYVGCSLEGVLEFLNYLDQNKIPVTLRQVIIPTLNDNEDNILRLKEIAESHKCVDKIELLPFKKMCQVKYDKMGIPFPFAHLPEPKRDKIKVLEEIL
ncbi:MAG: pyruvate formate lyase-activating protein [Clostridia bacterium]|nr:pyruvate formate lyase-activating protein [Clostridia bacterium]